MMADKRNPELQLIDSEMARLRLRRKLIKARQEIADLAEHVNRLYGQLHNEQARTTPDSVTALSDLTITRKLTAAQEQLAAMRARLRDRELDVARMNEAQAAAARIAEQRDNLAIRVSDLEQAERKNVMRIVAWLRERATHEGIDENTPSDVLLEAAEKIEKGLPE